LDEFVGPSKFQWTDEQLSVVNEQLEACLQCSNSSLPAAGQKVESGVQHWPK